MRGAFLLDAHRDDPPDFIVHMGSTAAVFPSLGQADYGGELLPGHGGHDGPGGEAARAAIDWVAWRDVGMAVTTGANGWLFRALRTEEGLDLLMAGLRSDHRRFLAGRIDYQRPGRDAAGATDGVVEEIAERVTAAAAAAADQLNGWRLRPGRDPAVDVGWWPPRRQPLRCGVDRGPVRRARDRRPYRADRRGPADTGHRLAGCGGRDEQLTAAPSGSASFGRSARRRLGTGHRRGDQAGYATGEMESQRW